tara:strand:- start:328 stop:555 length:228 start_codon:yes stop_codon:yes gene_type:complete
MKYCQTTESVDNTHCVTTERFWPEGDKEYKVVGWNIYVEVCDEDGNYHMEVWDIRNAIANQIDEELYYVYGDEEE